MPSDAIRDVPQRARDKTGTDFRSALLHCYQRCCIRIDVQSRMQADPGSAMHRRALTNFQVLKGADVVQNIEKAKTNPKDDKPYEDIKIVNIEIRATAE